MIDGANTLVFRHFGQTLGNKGVELLDPVVGAGTYITELIEFLPESQLPYKYRHEIHCNEVSILPYYIASLNIEYTYRPKMGEYVPFENICFVDTLDNMGFLKSGQHQMDFFAMVDENIARVQRQNERRISVIIGNLPYNAWQENLHFRTQTDRAGRSIGASETPTSSRAPRRTRSLCTTCTFASTAGRATASTKMASLRSSPTAHSWMPAHSTVSAR
jgi:predicted helicase